MNNPNVKKHLDPLYERTHVDYVLDLETTGMRSGFGTERTQSIAQAALVRFKEKKVASTYSKFTDVLLPVMQKFERGEITEQDFIRQLLTGNKDTPAWSRDILSRTNVMRGILGRQIEETVRSMRGGDKLVERQEIARRVMRRLAAGRSVGAWNYEFDFGQLKAAAYYGGFGDKFMEVFRKASRNGQIVEMSKPVHQFMYEEARLNAILPAEQRSKLQLVHAGDLAKVASWEKDRLAALSQFDKPLSKSEIEQILTVHKGFHTYFTEGVKDVLGEGMEGDKGSGTLIRFSEYEKWFKKYGSDWTRNMEAQGFLKGQMTPSIQFTRGWRLSDVLVPALFGEKVSGIGGHEAAADAVAAYRVANDVFGEYGRILDRVYEQSGDITKTEEHKKALLEARSQFSAYLGRKHKEGAIRVKNVDELTSEMRRLTVRDARRFMAAKVGVIDVRGSVAETAGQLKIVDTLENAGKRKFELESIGGVLGKFKEEVTRGAKLVWESKFGRIAAIAGGVALFDSIVGNDDSFKPEWHRNRPEQLFRDPRITRGEIGNVVGSWVQSHATASRNVLGATQAEMPVRGASFKGSAGDTGFVDIMSQRYGPLELKTLESNRRPLPEHIAQTKNYLRATGSSVGYTIFVDPRNPSNITISQIDAGASRMRNLSEFKHRIQGLRSANTNWSRWGGVRSDNQHFQSGFNAKAAADIIAGVSTETVAARGGTVLEHLGEGLFAAGASGAREATLLTRRQPISAKAIITGSVESGVRNYNQIIVSAAGSQVAGSSSLASWKAVRRAIRPRFYSPGEADRIVARTAASLDSVGQNAFFTNEFQGLRHTWNRGVHREMPGLELAAEWSRSAYKEPRIVPVGISNPEILPGQILTAGLLKPGMHGNFRVAAIRPGPDFVRDHTIKTWIQFHQRDGKWVLGVSEEFEKAFNKESVTNIELHQAGLRGKLRIRIHNTINNAKTGSLIGWQNLDESIQKELQELGLNAAVWDSYASRHNKLIHSLYTYLETETKYISTDHINLILSGRAPEVASKVGTKILTEGQVAEAKVYEHTSLKEGFPTTAKQWAEQLQPGGALSTLPKGGLPTINVLSSKNFKFFADPTMQGLRLEAARAIHSGLQTKYGLTKSKATSVVTQLGLVKSEDDLVVKTGSPPEGTTQAAAKEAKHIRFWTRNQNLLKAFNHTPHGIPLESSLRLSGARKWGRVLWESTMGRLFGLPFELRGAVADLVHTHLGSGVKVAAKLEPPEKGFAKWIYDVGNHWSHNGKGGLKSKVGKGLEYIGGASHFKMAVFSVGINAWMASSTADKYKSYPLGFGVEFAKNIAMWDIGLGYAQRGAGKAIAAGGLLKNGIPLLGKIPFVDVIAAMAVMMVVENIITPVMDKLMITLGLMDEPPKVDPTTGYYMNDLQGVDKQQYMRENAIRPGFNSNTTDFGPGGWQRPEPVGGQNFQVPPPRPVNLRRMSRNAGLVQSLGKNTRGSRTRNHSSYTPPSMLSGTIAA